MGGKGCSRFGVRGVDLSFMEGGGEGGGQGGAGEGGGGSGVIGSL